MYIIQLPEFEEGDLCMILTGDIIDEENSDGEDIYQESPTFQLFEDAFKQYGIVKSYDLDAFTIEPTKQITERDIRLMLSDVIDQEEFQLQFKECVNDLDLSITLDQYKKLIKLEEITKK